MKGLAWLVVAAALLGCGGGAAGNDGEATEPGASAGLANPASVNCEEKGGRLLMMEEEAGTFGVCVFDDGSRCEEWRFFRAECAPGECDREDGRCERR
jgi:putative hemolysin